jgi:cytidylate kinase
MNPENLTGTKKLTLVGVVGPCGSGKTTLIRLLKTRRSDLDLRHIAQEHSYVATMWQKIVSPDILIFLDASFEVATTRRKLKWTESEYQEQLYRLRDARDHADMVITTDHLSTQQVAEQVIEFIDQMKTSASN